MLLVFCRGRRLDASAISNHTPPPLMQHSGVWKTPVFHVTDVWRVRNNSMGRRAGQPRKASGSRTRPRKQAAPGPGFEIASDLYQRYLSERSGWSVVVHEIINRCLPTTAPDLLWHYCPMAALEGICSSRTIYLSDLVSMNDYQEGRWLRDQIVRRVSGKSRDFLPFLSSTKIRFHLGPFVASLSADGDLLSQWRAYASGGRGVAIGFRPDRLGIPLFRISKNQQPGYCALCEVIYDLDIQDAVLARMVDVIDAIVDGSRKYAGPRD